MIKLDLNPPAKQLRQFGFFAIVGFVLIGLIVTRQFGAPDVVGYIAYGLAAVCGLLAIANFTPPIKPIYIGVMIIAFPIGMVISFVLLGLIYYGMFTPVGFLFRLALT